MSIVAIDDETLTFRERSPLYQMLKDLSNGINKTPKREHECIILEIDKDPLAIDASYYDNRIFAFKEFLEDFFWIDTDIVGASNHCIRVYLRPRDYDDEIRKRVYGWLKPPLFHLEMARCEISRAFFYGKTLVVR